MRRDLISILLASAALLPATMTVRAQNPVIRDQFTADPTARVFNGRVYMYPSHDIPSPVKELSLIHISEPTRPY